MSTGNCPASLLVVLAPDNRHPNAPIPHVTVPFLFDLNLFSARQHERSSTPSRNLGRQTLFIGIADGTADAGENIEEVYKRKKMFFGSPCTARCGRLRGKDELAGYAEGGQHTCEAAPAEEDPEGNALAPPRLTALSIVWSSLRRE
eukprot:3186279-Rhodomonas_salina.1